MAYIAAADLRERTQKSFAANLVIPEGDATDAVLDAIIATVTGHVELDLADDFEPPNPDNDETVDADGYGTTRLYTPRRVRSITTVQTRWPWYTTYVTEGSTAWKLHKSLNSAGSAMIDGRTSDWLDAMTGLSTGVWPSGADTVRLVGKFGWAVVPEDIKRLVAKLTYNYVKAKGDPNVVQRQTVDAVYTYGPDPEIEAIRGRYQRNMALAYIG